MATPTSSVKPKATPKTKLTLKMWLMRNAVAADKVHNPLPMGRMGYQNVKEWATNVVNEIELGVYPPYSKVTVERYGHYLTETNCVKSCPQCGKEFTVNWNSKYIQFHEGKWCSNECYSDAYYEPIGRW